MPFCFSLQADTKSNQVSRIIKESREMEVYKHGFISQNYTYMVCSASGEFVLIMLILAMRLLSLPLCISVSPCVPVCVSPQVFLACRATWLHDLFAHRKLPDLSVFAVPFPNCLFCTQ